MIEARWLEIMVSSDHPLADERVAEAIARVLSRYWVDTASGVELIMTHRGANIAYLASRVYPVAGSNWVINGPDECQGVQRQSRSAIAKSGTEFNIALDD
jgi:hypothetical protein